MKYEVVTDETGKEWYFWDELHVLPDNANSFGEKMSAPRKKYIRADIAAPSWQPISTAPKDGTLFVACGVTSGNKNTNGKSYKTDPWVVWQKDGHFARWPHEWGPTHWMPLPTPPEEAY